MAKVKHCKAVNCTELTYLRSNCHKHYGKWRRSGKFIPRPVIKAGTCLADGCDNKSVGKGLCLKHYRRALRNDYKRAMWLCLILHALPYWQCHAKGCKRFKKTKNFCTLHYQRYRKWGKPSIVKSKAQHGMYGTPTYNSWQNMIQRCTNPKATGYAKYGGKGIAVADR
jgi:hypothetical protein